MFLFWLFFFDVRLLLFVTGRDYLSDLLGLHQCIMGAAYFFPFYKSNNCDLHSKIEDGNMDKTLNTSVFSNEGIVFYIFSSYLIKVRPFFRIMHEIAQKMFENIIF